MEVNLGTGVGSSVFDVIEAVGRISGSPVPYEVVGRRAGDPVSTYAAPEFAQQAIGWTAEHDLDTIVRTAYEWHRRTL